MTHAGDRFPNVETLAVGDVVDYRQRVDNDFRVVQVEITAIWSPANSEAEILQFEPV